MKYKNLEEPFFPIEFAKVWKWAVADRVWGRRREAPRRYRMPRAAPDDALLASEAPSLTWVGHATWLVRLAGVGVLTDPVWSHALAPGLVRNAPPGMPIEQAAARVVVVSHNHRDHLDAPTIDRLVRLDGARTFVVPEGLGRFFQKRGAREVVELGWWGETTVEGVTIAFVPSQHWSRRGAFDTNESLWGGFVLSGGGRRVYFAGDTAWFGGFREIGGRYPGIDAALLPIGAYDPEWFMRRQHMNPDDALRAFLDLGASLLCAMHWGTFKLTDEPLDEPPLLLEQARAREGVDPARVWVAAIGESRRL